MDTKVITWQAPSGETIDVCGSCETTLAGKWPRNSRGEEYCTVSRGLHPGRCTLCTGGNGRTKRQVGRLTMVRALEAEVGDIDGSGDLGVIVDCAADTDTLGDLIAVVLEARADAETARVEDD